MRKTKLYIIYTLLSVTGILLCAMPAYSHHEAVLPQRKYQKELARLPMQEYMHECLPEEAPFRFNSYETFLTVLDRGNNILDLILYAQNAKHIAFSGPIHLILNDSAGKALFNDTLAPDSSDTYRLRMAVGKPMECSISAGFTENNWHYAADFEFRMDVPGINYKIVGAFALVILASFAIVIIRKATA